MLSFQKYISEWLELDEGKGKPGLWANIHAKRKRGERPAKPGEEGYPKTLDIEEAMSPQQNMDFEKMMKGAMSRADYNSKWKKPLKSDAKVIYGKNVKESAKGYQPGWMLKKDPELAKKVKAKQDLNKKRVASYGNPAAGKSVKEETALQELSKDALRSYKHKAELSIPKDDREYANRSKGIDKAEKKLKEEVVTEGAVKDLMMNLRTMTAEEFQTRYKMTKSEARAQLRVKESLEQIDEMTQGKSYTQDQLRKKMQSGNWEATNDIKPGKHVEMRHHTGKRVMVHVKESVEQLDELSPNLLHRYVKKAAGNMGMHAVDHGKYGDQQKDKKSLNKAVKRLNGITSASGRMADKANQNEEMSPTEKAAFLAAANKKASLEYWKTHAALKKHDPRTAKAAPKTESIEDLDESTINDLTAQYVNENNITLEELENMTEAELNELIGAAIGGAFKLGAKAAVGATRLAGRAINRMTTSGRADAAEKKASTLEKKNADRERIKAAQDRLRKAKEAASKR